MDSVIIVLLLVVVCVVLPLSPAKRWLQHWYPNLWPEEPDPEATSSSQSHPSRDEIYALQRQVATWKLAVDQQNALHSRVEVVVGKISAQLAVVMASATDPSSNGRQALVPVAELERLIKFVEELKLLLIQGGVGYLG